MAETKLTSEETEVLAALLRRTVLRERSGEVGVVHGLDRFVSTGLILKKAERTALDAAASKLGLAPGIARSKT
jgi:hypothetical protein